ncbi:MAG: DDE-type integrase/transposase/recombinase [Gallionella sp.]|nr:DDE-type integrase/transposase/recombinase [Gallionella sp.]
MRLARGFAYLVAIIDWYSRRVLGWRISNSMDASFCVDCLEEAISKGKGQEIQPHKSNKTVTTQVRRFFSFPLVGGRRGWG